MQYRLLAGTDLSVSRVCLGTMTFGSQVDEQTAASMIDLSLERGINFLDTANVYNAGQSEAILGKVLTGRRDRVILASKVGIRVGDEADQIGLSPATIRRQIEDSLRRLHTDYLDLYYLHQPDYETGLEETLDAAGQLIQSGKVRCLGASNYASWQVGEMLALAERHELPPVRVTQPMYNLLARGIEQEFLPMCSHFGLSTIAYNPLAGGLLTGKHQSEIGPARGTRFERLVNYRERYWNAQNFEAVDALAAVADEEGRPLVGLALGWLLHHTPITAVIAGASGFDQLAQNLACAEAGPLSATAATACDRVWTRLRGPSPAYNR